jgi:hypothetical protein
MPLTTDGSPEIAGRFQRRALCRLSFFVFLTYTDSYKESFFKILHLEKA